MDLRGGPPRPARARGLRLAEHLAAARARRRSPSTGRASSSSCRSSTAPPDSSPAAAPAPDDRRRRARTATESGAAARRLADRARRARRARHGGRSATARATRRPFGARVEERYDGLGRRLDRRSRRTPGRADGPCYRIAWPEADGARPRRRLDVRSDADGVPRRRRRRRRGARPSVSSAAASAASSARFPAASPERAAAARPRGSHGRHGVAGGEVLGAVGRVGDRARAPGPRSGTARGSRAARPHPTRRAGSAGWNRQPAGILVGSGASPVEDLRLHPLAPRARRTGAPACTGAAGRRAAPRSCPARRCGRGT